MIIGLLGDLEGERDAAVTHLRALGERGDVKVVCQVGDLRWGMGADPDGYLAAIEAACAAYDLTMLVVPGNHEHWDRLDALWAIDPGPIVLSEHVTMLPRGHRWELGGRSFVALGGAPSVNRLLLTPGLSWWPGEVIPDAAVDATVAGGPADVLITHDSPAPPHCTPPVGAIVSGNPMAWPEAILAEADAGMAAITRAAIGVRPRLLVHGHFHVAGEAVVRLPGVDHDTMIWSLGARSDPATVRLLDLETLAEPLQVTTG